MYLEMKQVNELYQHIKAKDTIIIHRHVRPDPDALGSQLGLKDLIKNKFPHKKVLAAGTTSQGLKWMGEMDQVTREDYENALVIVTDTANQPRIDGKDYQQGSLLIKIDHHPAEDDYGDLQIVHPEASAASEIIALISQQLGETLPMTDAAAKLLYAGLLGDTGRFLFNSTTSTTFQVAAHLIDHEFDAFALSDYFNTFSLEQARLHGFVYNHLTFSDSGVAYLKITQETLKEFNVTEEESNSVVSIPGRIQGIVAWVVFVEQAQGDAKYRCRLRSKGPAINGLAARYDGGGHPFASGANAYSEAEVEQLIADLTVLVEEYQQT